jgi:hypothetical protein
MTGLMWGMSGTALRLVLRNWLLAEGIDFDTRVTGKRRDGLYRAMNGFIVRIALSIQYPVRALYFAWSGDDSRVLGNPPAQSASKTTDGHFVCGGVLLVQRSPNGGIACRTLTSRRPRRCAASEAMSATRPAKPNSQTAQTASGQK